ncbi:Uncharacterised protein [Mycobacteroides abscessus subsp. massiliense]|nr:Uncharacterised protein [Mycobacteroides abscessus subsp. massiliense]
MVSGAMTGMPIAVAVTARTATALDARRSSRHGEAFAKLRVFSVEFMMVPRLVGGAAVGVAVGGQSAGVGGCCDGLAERAGEHIGFDPGDFVVGNL